MQVGTAIPLATARSGGTVQAELIPVEKLKIASGVLGLAVTLTGGGCASSDALVAVERNPVHRSLVRGGADPVDAMLATRSDTRLGALSNAERREPEDAVVTVYDRQYTINGQFYNHYRSVTRTTERLRR